MSIAGGQKNRFALSWWILLRSIFIDIGHHNILHFKRSPKVWYLHIEDHVFRHRKKVDIVLRAPMIEMYLK